MCAPCVTLQTSRRYSHSRATHRPAIRTDLLGPQTNISRTYSTITEFTGRFRDGLAYDFTYIHVVQNHCTTLESSYQLVGVAYLMVSLKAC